MSKTCKKGYKKCHTGECTKTTTIKSPRCSAGFRKCSDEICYEATANTSTAPNTNTTKTTQRTRTKKSSSTTTSDISFLILTYGDLTHTAVMKKYLSKQHVYVHPKPNMIKDSFFKSKIIPENIHTKWGEMSIVQASIALLEHAFKETTDNWFILLSGDVYPTTSVSSLSQYLSSKSLSHFNLLSQNGTTFKTSQWWILCRKDVEIILSQHSKFIGSSVFNTAERNKQLIAYDEFFFLTLLKWNNPNYKYTQHENIYTRWLKNSISQHPVIFNKILQSDSQDIQKSEAFFLRKTLSSFSMQIHIPHSTLTVIYMGTETPLGQDYSKLKDNIIISALYYLPTNCISPQYSLYIFNIIYKFYYETVLNILYTLPKNTWKTIIFTSEKFLIKDINNMTIKDAKLFALPARQLFFNRGMELPNKPIFQIGYDSKNNPAFIYHDVR